jgi:prevent-host-death family protein
MIMLKTVNITALRTHLSRLLEQVKGGEEIEILDRSVPVARLVPVRPTTGTSSDPVPSWLRRQRRAGVVRVGTLKPVSEILRGFPGARVAGNAAVEAIIEERRQGR